MSGPTCACPALDSRDCLTTRYDPRMLFDDERCECVCHQPPDDGLDDDEREALAKLQVGP